MGIVALGVVLVLALFFWARRLLGARASWLVLVLAVFDPNLIANARLIGTDLPLTCFLVLAVWRLWCWLEERRWYDLVLAGICGGLTMAAKYNGLLFWPIALSIVLTHPRRRGADGQWRRLGAWAGMGLIGVATLWAVYRFTFGPTSCCR